LQVLPLFTGPSFPLTIVHCNFKMIRNSVQNFQI
jgi:hypothetical protein